MGFVQGWVSCLVRPSRSWHPGEATARQMEVEGYARRIMPEISRQKTMLSLNINTGRDHNWEREQKGSIHEKSQTET